ncbi:DUF349 domain-containing protein [Klenkia brasiliensis]|uniref:DUF349 domain-containing protein n=1 Tax=Klenkia brasiliensis TaxID=333142 RepID=A0A1G7ZQC2_9ACTN|nr:DUF349 domain-containing protein [Klenkia brasiliensis]SDH10894.1 protein of unknown function [Klenkia brasiliensis]
MSSTENTADVTPQPEQTDQVAGSDAVTPEAGTPASPQPEDAALADPTAEAAPADPTGEAPPAQDGAPPAAPTDGEGGTEEVPGTAEVVAAADVPAAGDVLDVSETPATTDAVGASDEDGAGAAAGGPGPVTVPDEAAVAEAADTPVRADDTVAGADPAETTVTTGTTPADGAPAAEATPAAPAATPAAPAAPAAPASDPTQWGRVDEEGTVYVRTADGGERKVGSWQAGEPAEGLAHYGRRYDDLATEVGLLEARLRAHTGNPAEIRAKAQALAEQVPTADVVGDLPALASRLGTIIDASEAAAAVSRAEKAKARAEQVARKEALIAEAETIGAESTQWKAAGDRLKAIVEEWKTIKGIDRKTDEALWTRFAAARDAFGRRRGSHFAALDVQRGESRAAKQELIAEAEKLSTSTEWGPTSAAMRSLMDRWKAVPRTGRDTDDDLWKKFRAAQDVFFNARSESDKARNSEQKANQEKKEALLAEAEKIDPTRDLRGAQNALRRIQERYDAIGHVPREVMRSLEDRMQAVEEKVRGAADSSRPRAVAENPMLTSLRAAAEKAADQLAKAKAAGDPKRISEAEANLASRQEFLAAAEKAGSRR